MYIDKKLCDLCNSAHFKILYPAGIFNIVKCENCDLVCRDKILAPKEAETLYDKDYFTVEQKDYFFNNFETKKQIFRERLRRLEVNMNMYTNWKSNRGGGCYTRYRLCNRNIFTRRS